MIIPEFSVKRLDVDESYPDDLTGSAIATYLAEKKAQAIQDELTDNELAITADTIVRLENAVLNKPSGPEEARTMLQALSGKKHIVTTGFSVTTKDVIKSDFQDTHIVFLELSDDEINFYVDRFEPFDKAGAYGIQEWIGAVGIAQITGDYYNVVGLPLGALYRSLITF